MKEADQIRGMHQFFYEFWSSNKMPNGSVLEANAHPAQLKSVLPNIVKIKNTTDGPRFSVVGTGIVDEYRQDFTGILVTEHPYEICREIYLSLIQRMNSAPGLKSTYGQFCYRERELLKTMEMAFPLTDEDGIISSYLVFVTVDHSDYARQLYFPTMPNKATSVEVDISTKAEFRKLLADYKNSAAKTVG